MKVFQERDHHSTTTQAPPAPEHEAKGDVLSANDYGKCSGSVLHNNYVC